ncbi:TPA: hypothetical protein ACSP3E_003714, partial [Aeromonas veronii]
VSRLRVPRYGSNPFLSPLNTSPHSTVIILDKADDPLGAGVTLVVARETNAQRFDLIVRRRLGWG